MSLPDQPKPAITKATVLPVETAQRYRVRHITEYRYQSGVVLAHHLLHLAPRTLPHQTARARRIKIEPTPSVTADHVDSFGNPMTYLGMQEPHNLLRVDAEMEIEVAPLPALDLATTPPWEDIRDRLIAAADAAAQFSAAFAYDSPHVAMSAELRRYAEPSFVAGRPIGLLAHELMERIYEDFTFDPAATTVSTPLREVLKNRRGVCQDLAHLQIGCLRAFGLPARYISGYLRTYPAPGAKKLEGGDASHAWPSVWCGGEQWLDVDPTNNQIPNTDYVTLAWGRDYSDVSPLRGVLFGGGRHSLTVNVDVSPLAAEAEIPAAS